MVLVGLGNPGPEYARTRHNVGFMAVESLALRLGLSFRRPFLQRYRIAETRYHDTPLALVEPLTYMNRSGEAVRRVLGKTGESINDCIVVCDTLDLPPGTVRLRAGGSDAGHRGLRSIIQETGVRDFHRLYIGIGRPSDRSEVVDYVLGEFGPDEQAPIHAAVERAADALLSLTDLSVQEVMNNVNRRTPGTAKVDS